MKFLEKQLEDPLRVRVIKRWCFVGLAALALAEAGAPFLFYPDHGHFAFEDLPAWGSLYGFISCVAIIIVSKLLGKLWLSRPEHHYDS